MGSKTHCESHVSGSYFMRDRKEDSSWPLFYGDRTVTNGHYYNGLVSGSTTIDGYHGEDKDVLKQKMVEHETVFKNQVCELHRLYRIQRNMMEQVQNKESHKDRASLEPSCSSIIHGSQPEDSRKWHMAGFSLQDTSNNRTSFLGVEIIDSPMSCRKRNNTQSNWFPFQNGSTSRNCEALESRPSKVRKKILDLQVPADQYADVEEGEDITEQKISSYDLNDNPEPFSGNRVIETNDLRLDGQASSSSRLKSFMGFADLNEPVKNKERDASCFDFLNRTSVNGEYEGLHNKSTRPNAGYLGVNEASLNVRNGFLMKSCTESKFSEKGWLNNVNETGSSKNNINPVSQGQLCHGPEYGSTGNVTHNFWTEKQFHGLKSADRNHDLLDGNNLQPLASYPRGSYSFSGSPSCNNLWTRSAPNWEKPNGIAQKMNTFESSLLSSSKNLLPYTQSQEILGMKWQVKDNNPGLNGYYHGSGSGLKEREHLPVAGFDFLNCTKGHNVAYDHLTNHGFGNFGNGFSGSDSKTGIDINSKGVHKIMSNKPVVVQDLNVIDENNGFKDYQSSLPWLKPKPFHCNNKSGDSRRLDVLGESSYFHSSSEHLSSKNERVGDLNQLRSSDCEILRIDKTAQSAHKILGVPIFGTVVREIEPLSNISTSKSIDKSASNKRKNRIIDINLECEPDEPINDEEQAIEAENQKNGTCRRDYIDLNSVVSDFENPSLPCESKSTKIIFMIDLESPALLESDNDTLHKVSAPSSDNEDVHAQNQALKNAAEIMIDMSSSCPQSDLADNFLDNPLLLFADAVISSFKEEEPTARDESLRHDSSDEIDDFEAMTLQLEEMKEEDCMPRKPFIIPQLEKVEDTEIRKLPNRPRRGQPRRARQRKDFQRDILPGMTSLSRHEVTEDLQTFGGLMKAMGHPWHSRLARKKGGGRGRTRAVSVVRNPVCTRSMQQSTNGEACLEDISITGWGKTTRRPRRQRCPTANLSTAVLS